MDAPGEMEIRRSAPARGRKTRRFREINFYSNLVRSTTYAGSEHLLILTHVVSIAASNGVLELAQTTYFHWELSTEDFIS